MDKTEIEICCRYGACVNMYITTVELLLEAIENNNEEDIELYANSIGRRISVLRRNEKDFQKLLGIKG